MVSEKDLLDAIEQCERDPITYQNIEKLANLYTVHDYLYGQRGYSYSPEPQQVEATIGVYGDSEFLRAIRGKKSTEAWAVMDELMEVLRLTNQRLYNGVIGKLDT